MTKKMMEVFSFLVSVLCSKHEVLFMWCTVAIWCSLKVLQEKKFVSLIYTVFPREFSRDLSIFLGLVHLSMSHVKKIAYVSNKFI